MELPGVVRGAGYVKEITRRDGIVRELVISDTVGSWLRESRCAIGKYNVQVAQRKSRDAMDSCELASVYSVDVV